MKLLIVTGAGASYDAYPNVRSKLVTNDSRLPLANSLFGNTEIHNQNKTKYPVASVEAKVNQAVRNDGEEFDIEATLYSLFLESQNPGRNNLKQQLYVARFYLRTVIDEINMKVLNKTLNLTTYVELVQALDDWTYKTKNKVTLVTFNYDSLIEESMRQHYDWQYPIMGSNDFSNYYKNDYMPIYKVHGSINWWRQGKPKIINGESYVYDACSSAYGKIDPKSFSTFIFNNQYGSGLPNEIYMPSIALPLREKTSFDDCPPEIIEHMRMNIIDVDAVLVIGWKAGDRHFVNELKKITKIKKIYIVNKSASAGDMAIKNLKELNVEFQRVDKKFSEFITDGTLNDVLSDFSTLSIRS